MKKIIATVLAMVMALALCTTAMAATTYGDFYKWDGGWVKQNMDGVYIYYGKPNSRAFSEAVGVFLWEKQGSHIPPKAALRAALARFDNRQKR